MDLYQGLSRQLRKFIYEKGWRDFTPIQKGALKYSKASNDNLILVAPTASGKTEAAFLPAIDSSLGKEGLKIIYISPLIALINDQFQRISQLCQDLEFPITSWHSESSARAKARLLKNPQGILLITPESIEAMLVNRPEEAGRLFKAVDWVLVDEIHGFSQGNRGVQLRSLLARIEKYMDSTPRYLGMSATVAPEDFELMKDFFPKGRETLVLRDKGSNVLRANLTYWPVSKGISQDAVEEIYRLSQDQSLLVFPNSRADVEELSSRLRQLARERGSQTRYFAHHASISKRARREAEAFALAGQGFFTIFATSTLEMGIDIGAVDGVVQFSAPADAKSLAQRLGRGGRRTGENFLYLLATNPFDLLQSKAALAMVEDEDLDKSQPTIKPFDILAHQFLSMLLERNGIEVGQALEFLSSSKAWKDIEVDEFRAILNHMHRENYIEVLESEVILGLEGEKFLNMGDFYAVFEDGESFRVYHKDAELGRLALSPSLEVGRNIILGSRTWEICEINYGQKRIQVVEGKKGEAPLFIGAEIVVSCQLRSRMRKLIEARPWEEDEDLNPLREISIQDKIEEDMLRTYLGTRANQSLIILCDYLGYNFRLEDWQSLIRGRGIEGALSKLADNFPTSEELKDFLLAREDLIDRFYRAKYRELLPLELRAQYIIDNILAVDEVRDFLGG